MTISSLAENIPFIGVLIAGLSLIISILAFIFSEITPRIKNRRRKKRLQSFLGTTVFGGDQLEFFIKYYIRPRFQNIDPARVDEPGDDVTAQEDLLNGIDRIISKNIKPKYIIILADTGMGKTSFCLNYFTRYMRRPEGKRDYDMILFPLTMPNVDEEIRKIKNKERKIIILDAFDEDRKAIENHEDRMDAILNLTEKFARIIITCRTQFFPDDASIPSKTARRKYFPTELGESGTYEFQPIYISPFTDKQCTQFINLRYHFWQRKKRRLLREIVSKIPKLSVRPMLLTHIDEFESSKDGLSHSFQIYEVMVDKWLEREAKRLPNLNKMVLREFSNKLAMELVEKSTTENPALISQNELIKFSSDFGINLKLQEMRSRSLLNRDSVGNYKFAHKSIKEFSTLCTASLGFTYEDSIAQFYYWFLTT